ncbi:MAG: sodium-dependent transporter [Acidobacteriota bacterium]
MQTTQERGLWSSKLGFVLAAAGSAVGLGNIWKFPSEVADNGGAAFLVVYILCCFIVGFPVMVAELAIGRKTRRNPVGAFKVLSGGKGPWFLIGGWGILCGIFILSFYLVVAGWTLSFVVAEIAKMFGAEALYTTLSTISPGVKTAIFTVLFMVGTVGIVLGGVAAGIERATKTLMPALIGMLLVMIGFVLTRDGAMTGLTEYLKPDLGDLNTTVIFSAMAQAFFSLSLGMGALITYGSYLDEKESIPEAAALVTTADFSIAFLAGLLIMPAMYVAQGAGIEIINPDTGALINSDTLVFAVLPQLFDAMGGLIGVIFGFAFFVLLSMAALTSTISLLEVPVSFGIDELKLERRKSTLLFGILIGAIAVVVSFNFSLIGHFDLIFNQIGLPLGGFMICIFLAYVWTLRGAFTEMESGYPGVATSTFGKVWSVFVRFICPLLILLVFITTVWTALGL